MMKFNLNKKIFLIPVLLIMALFALLAAVLLLNNKQSTLTAAATTTPKYLLNVNYVYTEENTKTNTVTVKQSGTTTSFDFMGTASSINLYGAAHTGTSQTLNNNAYFNFTDLTFSFSGKYNFVVMEGSTIPQGVMWHTVDISPNGTISRTYPEGKYTLTIIDISTQKNILYSLKRTFDFCIDTTDPGVWLSCDDDYGFSNNSVTVEYGDANGIAAATYSRSTTESFPTSASTSFSNGTMFTEPGNYTIKVTDKAGNVTIKHFTIDKSAPTLSLSCGNEGFTNGAVTATWSNTTSNITSQRANSNDALTVQYSYSTTSSFPTSASTIYSSNTPLTEAGNYYMTISDKAGNSTSYTFTIDKSAPTLSLSCGNEGFTNGAVTATWSNTTSNITSQRANSNDALTVKYSYSTSSSFPTSASTTYSSGTSLTTAGNYLMVISDKAGNSTSYTFTIDKSAPTLSLSCGSGGFTNGAVTATWATTTGSMTSQRSNSNDALTVKYTYSTSNSFPSSASTVYSLNTPLTEAGNYYMTISDKAGNSTSYTFTIDKSAPTLTLSTSDSTALINGRTKANVSVSWGTAANGVTSQRSNSADVLTVLYARSSNGSFPTSADTVYAAGTILTTEGKYLIVISDRAGNISETYFEIYRKAPTFSILSEAGAELHSDYNAFREYIKLVFASDLTATLDRKAYTSGTLISGEGEYDFILTDELGNRTTETIYIITTPPTANFDKLKSSLNRWYETTGANGTTLSFASYDNAYNAADARERALVQTGQWIGDNWDGRYTIAPDDRLIAAQGMTYYVYKSYSSPAEYHAYFSLASLNKSIEKYASISVTTKYTPSTPAPGAEGEVIYRDIYFSNSEIRFSTIANCNIYVDGIKQSYPYSLTAPGLHNIVETDIAGNSVAYQVYIDIDRPIVRVTNLNGNLPESLLFGDRAYYFTYGIRLYLDDVDDQALLQINDDYYLGGVVELRAAGQYTIKARDAAGNAGSLVIYISLIEPTIEFQEVEVSGVINSFTVTIRKNYTDNEIKSLGIYMFSGEQWILLEYDNSSRPVLIDYRTLTYSFNITGKYRVVVFDVFGHELDVEYNFIQGSPKGSICSTTNEELPNGAYVKSSVYFTWVTALNCHAEISRNGGEAIAYEKGTFITTEGEYTIKLISDTGAGYNIYTFTIDKTAPTARLMANGEELKNGATTKFAVSLTDWSESGCTATFNGQPYPAGTEISEDGQYTIVLTDRAGNKTTYTFRIKTTPPTISIIAGSTKLSNYGITKSDVYITWTESNCTCLVNGAPYTANTKIRIEGTYSVVLIDAYGNTATNYFTIDKTAPVGVLEVDGKPIEGDNISTNKTVALTWTESGCTAVINRNFVYISGTQIKEDGVYTIVLSDAAGNTTTYSFTIKTAPPKATLYANNEEVASGSATRFTVRLTWTESGCTATLNGQPYSKGVTISAEGSYTFIVSDSFGNSGTWEITIDKTAPVISIISDGIYLSDGDITRYNTYVLWDDPEASATLNGTPVNNGACIEDEGEFTLIVTDAVGNRSSQVFIIDKTAKIGSVISNTKILSDGDITRYNTYFTWTESGCTATLNGQPYSKGTLIREDGTYTIVLTDRAGNSTSYNFTIDKTPPVGTLYIYKDETLTDAGESPATSGSLVFTWDEEGCTATLNGEPYERGTEVSAEGEYTFILTDAAGNTSTYTGRIDKTPPEIAAYTNDGALLDPCAETRYNVYFTWSERNCTATLNGEPYSKETMIRETGEYTLILIDAVGNVSTITISIYKLLPTADIIPIGDGFALPYLNNGFIVEWDEEGCTATLNGQPYERGTEVSAEGEYQLVIFNRVRASTVYEIIVDRTAPTAQIFTADSAAEEVTADFSIKSVYFTWTESGCTATLNGKPYSKGEYITTSGGYTLILTDKAGNSAMYQILITKSKPELYFVEADTENEIRNGGSTTKEVQVVKYNDEDIVTLNGEVFDTETKISAVGKYTFVVTNKYGNSAEFTITIKDAAAAQEEASNNMPQILKGSSTGTIIFFSVLAVLAVGLIVVPIIGNRVRGGGFKKKLK